MENKAKVFNSTREGQVRQYLLCKMQRAGWGRKACPANRAMRRWRQNKRQVERGGGSPTKLRVPLGGRQRVAGRQRNVGADGKGAFLSR